MYSYVTVELKFHNETICKSSHSAFRKDRPKSMGIHCGSEEKGMREKEKKKYEINGVERSQSEIIIHNTKNVVYRIDKWISIYCLYVR